MGREVSSVRVRSPEKGVVVLGPRTGWKGQI